MILVVVNLLTKLPHFLPLKHPFTAEGVAAIFSKEIMQSTWYSKKHYLRQDRVSSTNPVRNFSGYRAPF